MATALGWVEAAFRSAGADPRIGAHLERAYGAAAADHAAELAHHYVAGEDPANAVRFLRASAERAFARSAAVTGLRHLRDALAATAQLPDGPARTRLRADLLAQIGQASVAVEGSCPNRCASSGSASHSSASISA